jgi:hypothetical protein
MMRRLAVLPLALVLLAGGADAAGGKLQLLDRLSVSQGLATVNLVKGTVSATMSLAPVPATIDTGTEQFTATLYKAYLTSTTDAAVEIPVATLYPTVKGKTAIKAALKGDVSHLGLDRLVVVAYSKDGLSSFDVLTATLPTQ